MAKIIHNNAIDVIDSVFSAAKEKGIMHLNSDEETFDGTKFTINGKRLKNFGTCGYMGLSNHPKLIEGAINLTKRYGTQLSMSRAFMRPLYIRELEELLSQIFNGNKAICYSSTSSAHISVIGTVIKPDDLIIIDQQVHFSVQYPAKSTRLQGTEVKMIKHSDYEMLDQMISEETNKYNRIWYMADGVYSMHGDIPDTKKLKALMDKHPKLNLYFDDAHGMSWGGKKGAGLVFDQLGINNRIILISTLAKGFGSVGGTAIFSDPEIYRKVDVFGGPLSYSHPLSPANVGAAIESAKIHLSNEIYQYQDELRTLTSHMDKRLAAYNLTNLSAANTPIYCIGVGYNKVTRNFVHRILGEGLYVNTATFPVVPNDKSGLRFTITRDNKLSDVDELADVLAYHFPKAIAEENDTLERVYKKFDLTYIPGSFDTTTKAATAEQSITVEEYTTINDIDKELWDSVMEQRGSISHSGMQCTEEIFSGNQEKENNWSFHYLLIKDKTGKLVCATFFTGAIYKDDLLALENVSKKIEEVRKTDPYYLCSKTLAMGSMFAEGDFIYIDNNHTHWREAIDMIFAKVEKIKKEISATVVVFRDFEENHCMNKLLEDEGYVKIRMPNSNVIKNPKWENYDELLKLIKSKNNRNNIKRYAFRNEHLFETKIKNSISEKESKIYFDLFSNVKDKNYGFNFFKYPKKVTSILSKYKNWEFIEIRLKENNEIICVMWCFKGDNHYCPLIMGLDYNYSKSHHTYTQAIFQTVKRGNELNKDTIYLGFSADFEKQKYGAKPVPKFAFMKVDDTYNMELIESYSNNIELVESSNYKYLGKDN